MTFWRFTNRIIIIIIISSLKLAARCPVTGCWPSRYLDERLEGGEFLLPLVQFNVLCVVVQSEPSHASRADRTVVLLVGSLILARSTHTHGQLSTPRITRSSAIADGPRDAAMLARSSES